MDDHEVLNDYAGATTSAAFRAARGAWLDFAGRMNPDHRPRLQQPGLEAVMGAGAGAEAALQARGGSWYSFTAGAAGVFVLDTRAARAQTRMLPAGQMAALQVRGESAERAVNGQMAALEVRALWPLQWPLWALHCTPGATLCDQRCIIEPLPLSAPLVSTANHP
jgi:hypothetical protein